MERGFRRPSSRLAAALCGVALMVHSLAFAAELEGSGPTAQEEIFGSDAYLRAEALVREVLARNPTVESARLAWREAVAREPQAGSLDDPALSYAVAPRTIGSDSRYGNVVSLSQRFPFPGKLALRERMARTEAAATREDYEATRRELATVALALLGDAFALERSLETNAHHVALVRDLKASAEAQYVAGRASQQDPIQAELELGRLLRQEEEIRSRRHVVLARINGLLHRRPDAPLPPPPSDLELSDAPLPEPSALAEQALADRPELRAVRSRVEAAEAALALARREYFPDFGVATRYDSFWDDSRQRFIVELSVDLPIRLARRAAAAGEATSRLERLRREHDRLSDEVRVEVEQAHRRLVESRRATELYADLLLPAARDRVAAARSSFETGRAPFLVPIEAAKDQREVELELHEERAELYRRQAELERALGRIPGQPSEGGIQ